MHACSIQWSQWWHLIFNGNLGSLLLSKQFYTSDMEQQDNYLKLCLFLLKECKSSVYSPCTLVFNTSWWEYLFMFSMDFLHILKYWILLHLHQHIINFVRLLCLLLFISAFCLRLLLVASEYRADLTEVRQKKCRLCKQQLKDASTVGGTAVRPSSSVG